MTHAERERLFLDLFRENRSRILRLCSAYLHSAAEAEDLFQDIMTNVWHHLPGFRQEARASTWLYRIAVNTALIYRRKWKPAQVLKDALTDVPDGGLGAQRNLEEQERLTALRGAIGELPGQDRLIVTLLLEGLSYKEIAEITGITANYVGVRISRIKQALEQRMAEVAHGAV
ncbi:MAG TPA: sigma-70 family RNA polymerase sigma factor [Candidatus Acidoferrales bacterium]|jgi:RNA polymerase sigma-70 factor (ECF subfamily)|nr:sigma-70 family RNA polymerase sigma factor [Candidatus Acidoferrales bacterium]